MAEEAQNEIVGNFFHRLFRPAPTVVEISSMTIEELLDANMFGGGGSTPLGHSLKNGIALEALTLWLDRAPGAISVQNTHGNISLSQVGERAQEEQALAIASRTPPSALLLLDGDGDTPFHCVLQNRASSEVLRTALEKCPDGVFSTANEIGRLPIHDAIENGAALDIVKSLICRSPSNALATTDALGRLPIHLLTSRSSPEVTDLLLRLSPSNVLLQEDNQGMLPLHCALYSNAQNEVIATLVGNSPNSVYATDKCGRLPLHFFLERSQFATSSVNLLLGERPRTVLQARDKWNRMPLSIAIRNGAGPEAVKLLLDHSPSNILTTNIYHQGRTPLACAVEASHSLDVVEMLVDRIPMDILLSPDKKGKIPLHYVQRSTPAEIVELLAEKCPGMLMYPDSEGKLPIHYAIHRGVHLAIVKVLVKHNVASLSIADNHMQLPVHIAESSPDDVKFMLAEQTVSKELLKADKDGRLPLHRALRSGSSSAEQIELLVNRCPEALFHFDASGRLPLYYAIVGDTRSGSRRFRRPHHRRNGMRRLVANRRLSDVFMSEHVSSEVDIPTLLAERAPETIGLIDPQGRVLLHDLCKHEIPLEIVELMVRLCPAALHHVDRVGRLPLHYAVEKQCSSEMVQVFLEGFPGAVMLRDKQGRLPLFLACESRASLDVIFKIARWAPEILCELV